MYPAEQKALVPLFAEWDITVDDGREQRDRFGRVAAGGEADDVIESHMSHDETRCVSLSFFEVLQYTSSIYGIRCTGGE